MCSSNLCNAAALGKQSLGYKMHLISRLPKMLVFHLKRFSYELRFIRVILYHRIAKSNRIPIEIPTTIDLSAWSLNKHPQPYVLFSVCIHKNATHSIQSGHCMVIRMD